MDGSRPTNTSIRKRLISALVCLAIVPILFVGSLLIWHSYREINEQVKELQETLTEQVSEKVSLFFDDQEHKVVSMYKTHNLLDLSPAQQSRALLEFLSISKEKKYGHVFNEIALLDAKGKEVVRQSRLRVFHEGDLRDRANREEYLVPLRTGKSYYSQVRFDKATGTPLMQISVPIQDVRTLAVKGILVAEMNLMTLRNLVADTKIGKIGSAYLIDQSNQVVVHPNPSIILQHIQFDAPAKPDIMRGVQGERAVVATQSIPLNNSSLLLVTEIPTSEAYRHLPHTLTIIGTIILITLAGTMMLGAVVVRQIVSPIESLAKTAQEISSGDFSRKAEPMEMDELSHLSTAFNSMTARLLETINNLMREKNFVRNVIEALSHPFYVIDVKNFTIKLANSAAGFGILNEESKCHKLTHNSDKPCCQADHPCTIEEIKKTGKPVILEHIHYLSHGEPRTYEVYGFPIFDDLGDVVQVIEYQIDITERKLLEEQLRQSQKLEALGSLAGGVAHDINNILTVILGYSEIMMLGLSKNDPMLQRVKVIADAGNRATNLTRQLLAFSRKQVMEMQVFNLNYLLKNMTKMLGRLIGENIEIKLNLRDTAGNIEADPGQVEQIIMNLSVNARDAMPDGGTLLLETDTVEFDELYCRRHSEATPGCYVMLSVTDSGHGLKKDIKDKIFEPFFTTKAKGEGTGLGLSTVYGIMKQLKGHIFVYSEEGHGTTFKIYFPEIKEKAEEIGLKLANVMQHGTETILVVDDESAILDMIYDTLEPIGYKVLTALCGDEAIEVSKNEPGKIDLLLTDVIMPGLSCKQLAEMMEQMRPGIKTLFMSGYTDDIIARQGVLDQNIFFINKPLIPSQLTEKIRMVLDS